MMITALALATATTQFFSGNDLYRFCLSANAADRAFCNGFVSAVADTERTIDTRKPFVQHICMDNAVEIDQVRDVVVQFLVENPEGRDFSAASIASVALERAFPCK
jgi:hypothetical protein